MFKRVFSREKRKELAGEGKAMAHGGYPIESAQDLRNAIQAFGRAKNPEATKRHIIRRARALGLTNLLPEAWSVGKHKGPGNHPSGSPQSVHGGGGKIRVETKYGTEGEYTDQLDAEEEMWSLRRRGYQANVVQGRRRSRVESIPGSSLQPGSVLMTETGKKTISRILGRKRGLLHVELEDGSELYFNPQNKVRVVVKMEPGSSDTHVPQTEDVIDNRRLQRKRKRKKLRKQYDPGTKKD